MPQKAGRPAVGDNVVHVQHKGVLTFSELEQESAEQWATGEIERTPGFFSNVTMLVFVGTSGRKLTTFDDVLNAWLSNPTTNASLFDPNLTRIGFNQVDANGTTFWTLVLVVQALHDR